MFIKGKTKEQILLEKELKEQIKNLKKRQIEILNFLNENDWQIIKIMELEKINGLSLDTKYTVLLIPSNDIFIQKNQLRQEYNNNEAQINQMQQQIDEINNINS